MKLKTILLAEDNEDDVFLVKRALARAGVRALLQVVPDGEMALAYLRGEGDYSDRMRFPFPNVTLLDIKMPKKSGFEVLQAVRLDPQLMRLPVVFFSSSGENVDVNRAFDLHANSYLVKPSDPRFLETLLQKLEHYWLELNCAPVCPA